MAIFQWNDSFSHFSTCYISVLLFLFFLRQFSALSMCCSPTVMYIRCSRNEWREQKKIWEKIVFGIFTTLTHTHSKIICMRCYYIVLDIMSIRPVYMYPYRMCNAWKMLLFHQLLHTLLFYICVSLSELLYVNRVRIIFFFFALAVILVRSPDTFHAKTYIHHTQWTLIFMRKRNRERERERNCLSCLKLSTSTVISVLLV